MKTANWVWLGAWCSNCNV